MTLTADPQSIVGIVGPSGSGKTLLMKGLAQLLPPNCTLKADTLTYHEKPLSASQVSMVFQDPQMALNPTLCIGYQIAEGYQIATKSTFTQAKTYTHHLLERMHLDPQKTFRLYPYELSGGMCQRALMAIALSCQPSLLIADEPTASLDFPLQEEILTLLVQLQKQLQFTLLLVTHDLPLARRICQKIYTLHNGECHL